MLHARVWGAGRPGGVLRGHYFAKLSGTSVTRRCDT
jgi:hypothetical protein